MTTVTTWQAVYIIASGALNVFAMVSLAAIAFTAVRDQSKPTRQRRMPPHQMSRPQPRQRRQPPPAFRDGPPPGEQPTQVMQVPPPNRFGGAT